MKKSFFIALFLVCAASGSWAQARSGGWLASFNTVKLGKRTSLHYDMQFRSSDKVKQLQTMLFRSGLNYHLRKNMIATAGYALVENRRSLGRASGYVPEHRIWEQFIVTHPIRKAATQHRFRLEQRWIGQPEANGPDLETDEYAAAHRLRYFFRSVIPLHPVGNFEKGVFVAVQNEVFGNLGDKTAVNGRFFDQNRLYLAGGYRLGKKADIEAGYMNQYVNGRGRNFTNSHIVQLALYTRL